MLTYCQRFFSFSLFICAIYTAVLSAQQVTNRSEKQQAVLQAAILVQPTAQPTQFQTDKIQPGHSVKISLVAENIGNSSSPAGKIFVRFALAKPLDNEPNSVVFETETVDLPSIQPGHSIELAFEKTHQWPSLPDFIKDDWGMREYQAVVDLENHKEAIGSLAITFSAYYYPGVRKELPYTISP